MLINYSFQLWNISFFACLKPKLPRKASELLKLSILFRKKTLHIHTVFPHIVSAETILF